MFCEVKEKAGDGFGDPVDMVGEEKQRRIRRAAKAWLAVRPQLHELDVRFEVVSARGRSLERVPLDLLE